VWWVDPIFGPRRALATPAPTFLAQHPGGRRLYAVSEGAHGVLTVFGPDGEAGGRPGSLRLRSTHDSGGSFPCHVVVDPGGRRLIVAHYGGGIAASFPLDRWGDIGGSPTLLPASGSPGPRADRQDGPHAHSTTISPDGRFALVADLGTDELRRYRLTGDGPPAPDGVACVLPAGSGPRHLAFRSAAPAGDTPAGRASWTLYATLELSAEVAVLSWDAPSGTASLVGRHALPRAARDSRTLPSHLVPAGGRLIVAVRGPDVLADFRIADGGALTLVSSTPTVAWPRHFAVLGDWLVVAGERSDAVGRHALAGPDGGLGDLVHRDLVPAPACVVDAAGWRS
jgi:6-phosphogluconolactonase (cycloisomerase 2 family)